MEAQEIQRDFYQEYLNERDRRDEKRSKQSFWASDCLKPMNELFWAWTNVPRTNPVTPEKLSMFDVGKLCELHMINRLIMQGLAADLQNEDHVKCVEKALGKRLAFAKEPDEFGKRQIRMEMERQYVPITGYLDGITLKGYPIEVKSTRSTKYIGNIARGKLGQIEHLYQLACYMDFLGVDKGLLAVVSRPDGCAVFVELKHLGDYIYQTGSQSIGLPEEMGSGDEEIHIEPTTFDLEDEFKRWRKLYEDYIHPNIEPKLEYEYKATLTNELLSHYNETQIKNAIRGRRMLSSHEWKPQYCDWRNLWVEKEMKLKGYTKVGDFLKYTPDEEQFMMDYLGVEWRDTKGGRKLYKKKK